jgi:hypothetical protein
MEEFNLNNKENLNPSLGDKLSKEDKKELISKWNKNPINKENQIKAINTEYSWLKNMGIFFLIIISLTAGVFAYLAWKDGTLLNPASNCVTSPVDCGNTTIGFENGSVQCGDCNCGYTNITLNPQPCNMTEISLRLLNLTAQVMSLNCS